MPVEGYDCKTIEMKYGELREILDARMGAGTYTDDTEMMIGIAESLVQCRGFNGRDMAGRFVKLYNPERGYGGGTVKALSLLREGMEHDLLQIDD